jgi:glycosyltransferase involved in cell wall biosynthesis
VRLLLIHQNFPGQFRQLAPHLEGLGHELVAIGSHHRPVALQGRLLRYEEPAKLQGVPLGSQVWHDGLERAARVARLVEGLDREGWRPQLILGHSGWGETLGLSQVWPTVPQVLWPELWVRPEHGGYGVDPLKPAPGLESRLEQLGRNALTRTALADASCWVLPTQHQAQSLPAAFRDHRLHVIHEGIDTHLAKPNPAVRFEVRNVTIDRSVPTITFVNRNLERLRGFDLFMRAVPLIQRQHPEVRVLIVGDNEPGYGGGDGHAQPLRERMLQELQGQLDLERIHFLGRVPHPVLIALLQASWVHVYLSYPFILGWSLLEAMACGCCIVGSEGMPVAEAINHNVEGCLVPLDQPGVLAEQVLQLLHNPQQRQRFGVAARRRALLYDQRLTLAALTQLLVRQASAASLMPVASQ